MAQLTTKIKIYLDKNNIDSENFLNHVELQDDMVDGVSNPYIKKWNLEINQPTENELQELETEANKFETNNTIIDTRKKLYGSWEKQLEEINEQGIDAWKERIAQIKADNPKES